MPVKTAKSKKVENTVLRRLALFFREKTGKEKEEEGRVCVIQHKVNQEIGEICKKKMPQEDKTDMIYWHKLVNFLSKDLIFLVVNRTQKKNWELGFWKACVDRHYGKNYRKKR